LVTTDEFLSDAMSSAHDNGMPPMRAVALPASTYYRGRGSLEDVRPVAAAALDEMIAALTRPLTAEEENPPLEEVKAQVPTVSVTGEDYADAAEKVNRLFLENRWADGLPILPPTEKAVRLMLQATGRAPDEEIGLVKPKNGMATVRKIAVNAVMAGARPDYLPVIIAAMEGFTDENYDLTHVQASTGSFTPAIIVSGPLAEKLNFNSGMGLLGHGYRANNTVGRALRLCLLNLGQTWPGENDMALIGRLSSHTFFTFAENTAASPWEPYHVALGYQPEESTVTVSTVGGQVTMLGGGAVAPWSAQGILNNIVSNISNIGTYLGGVYAAKRIVVLHPDCAAELAEMGYTRQSLQEYLYEEARIPYSELRPNTRTAVAGMIDDGLIHPDRAPIFRESLRRGGKVPVVQRPEDIHILVAGGSPGYSFLIGYSGPNWAHQTRVVETVN
jgi:hypothetical protein